MMSKISSCAKLALPESHAKKLRPIKPHPSTDCRESPRPTAPPNKHGREGRNISGEECSSCPEDRKTLLNFTVSSKKSNCEASSVTFRHGSQPSSALQTHFKESQNATAEENSFGRRVIVETIKKPSIPDNKEDGRKRYGITLEVKVEIINRVNSGEKRIDVANDYGINSSTVKSILKKSDVYLKCWKNGEFRQESKRLRGALREDLDDVIHYWYTQVKGDDFPVSRALLCSKAMVFAKKLGYHDFKASNGWLSRFKKRRGISLANPPKELASETQNSLTPGLSNFLWDSCNIFTVQETALLYKALPTHPICQDKCDKNANSAQRFSLLLCTNMSATEKLPLLVVGNIPRKNFKILVKNSPVQYIQHGNSWLTKESVFSWLLDFDNWLLEQGRKISLLLSKSSGLWSLPNISLTSITFQTVPLGFGDTILGSFKLNYRQSLLSEYNKCKARLNQPHGQHEPRFSLDCYVNLMSRAWQEVSESDVRSCFQRAGMGRPQISEHFRDLHLKAQPELLQEYKNNYPAISSMLSFKEYIHLDDCLAVSDEHSLDCVIAKVINSNGPAKETLDCLPLSEQQQECPLTQQLEVLEEYVKAHPENLEMNAIFAHFKLLIKKIL